jgi:NADH dehydrogenase
MNPGNTEVFRLARREFFFAEGRDGRVQPLRKKDGQRGQRNTSAFPRQEASMPEEPASNEKIHAVTGAFGFSGKYLARRLLDEGKRVITLTASPNRPDPFAGRVRAFPYLFSDPKAMAESLKGVGVLYNTYWVRFNYKDFSHAEAVRNTLALFEAARLAGVERIVHVSITNADTQSPLEYFACKGLLENALRACGLSYAIVRPAVLFGREDILINNIAWALRRFPVFCLFGDGSCHIRPIFVEDLATLMADLGKSRELATVNALGPEEYTWRGLVTMLADALGKKRRFVQLRPTVAWRIIRLLGLLVGDEIVTREEMDGLLANTLYVPGAESSGTTRLSDWARENRAELGRVYHGELDRRTDRTREY